jgi:hypothetical protein
MNARAQQHRFPNVTTALAEIARHAAPADLLPARRNEVEVTHA